MYNKKISDAKYYLKNKKQIRARQKEYTKKYRDTIKRKNSWDRYNRTPKGFYQVIKTNSKMKGRDFDLSQEDFLNWYIKQEKKCFYCDIPQKYLENNELFDRPRKTRVNRHRLQIDRINNDVVYRIDNIVLACPRCNTIKSNFFTADETREIAQKYIKPKWQK